MSKAQIIKQGGFDPTKGWQRQIIEGHLGGCSEAGDPGTYYPLMWDYMVDKFNIKSVVDVGAGMGYSSKYFKDLGCDIVAIDGSVEVYLKSLVQGDNYLHDYQEGPFFAANKFEQNFDLAWCCEFVEHVYEQYTQNFIEDFKRCKYVAMTHAVPGQNGHHHVNLQPADYWIYLMQENGFDFLEEETMAMRKIGIQDRDEAGFANYPELFYFTNSGLFFINRELR